jgi:hypothetical protein
MAALVVEFVRFIYRCGVWGFENVTGGIALAATAAGSVAVSSGGVMMNLAGDYVVPGRDGVISRMLGFGPDPFRQNAFGNYGLRVTQTFRQMIADLRNLIRIPVMVLAAALIAFGEFLLLLYPTLFWGLLVLFLLYLMQEYWPLVYSLLIHVGVPLINVGILIFNVVFWFIIVIYFVISMIWNIFVPFIGFFVFILSDLFGTILKEVFDVLGNSQILSFFQELNQITTALTQLVMQILSAFIKVGLAEIQFLVKIISFIITLIMSVIRIVMDILTWVTKLLFPILKPILWTVQIMVYALSWLFGGIQGARTSRSLLSLSYSAVLVLSGVEDPLADDGQSVPVMEPDEDFYDVMYEQINQVLYEHDTHYPAAAEKQFIEEELSRRKFEMDSFKQSASSSFPSFTSRKTMATAFGSGGGGSEFAETTVTDMFGEALTNNLKGMKTEPMSKVAQEALERITYYPTVHNPYSVESILLAYWKQNPDAVRMPKDKTATPSKHTVEHPTATSKRLKKEREEYLRSKGIPEGYDMELSAAGGHVKKWGQRQLLERKGDATWSPEQLQHIEVYHEMVKNHEDALKKQHDAYMDQQFVRMGIVDKTMNVVNEVIDKHADRFLHVDNIKFHMDSALEHYGYRSFSDLYNSFNEKNPNAHALMENIGKIGDHWVFRSLAKFDPRAASNPYFHDWSEAQKLHGKRRPLDIGTASDSHEKEGDFPIVSSYNCFTSPRNPLCLPDLGLSPLFIIPDIKLPDNIFNQDTYICAPWVTSGCIFCWDRIYNFFQTIRFIISVIPPVNRFLTIYTYVLPSFRWTVDWLFLVPKGALGSLHDVICAIGHLYDVAITIIVLWIFFVLVYPVLRVLTIEIIQLMIATRDNNESIAAAWQIDLESSPNFVQYRQAQLQLAQQRYEARRVAEQRQLTRERAFHINNHSTLRRRRGEGVVSSGQELAQSRIGEPLREFFDEFAHADQTHSMQSMNEILRSVIEYLKERYHITDVETTHALEEHILEIARNSTSLDRHFENNNNTPL